MKNIKRTLLGCGFAAALLAFTTPVQALNCGIFAFEGGTSTINSGTSMVGDVCYNQAVTSTTNAKLPKSGNPADWNGGAYVHSLVNNFQYSSKDFLPNNGIHTSGYDAQLEALDAAYKATASYYQAQTPTQTVNTLWTSNQSLGSTNGVANTTIINFSSAGGIDFNSNTLTLTGDSDDKFIFNFANGAGFSWSQSQTVLHGIAPENILFNFWGGIGGSSTINKDSTVFFGTILAPNTTKDFIYHNPATFEGAIFAKNIDVHSDFNLVTKAFTPVPLPAAVWVFGSGLLGLLAIGRRKKTY